MSSRGACSARGSSSTVPALGTSAIQKQTQCSGREQGSTSSSGPAAASRKQPLGAATLPRSDRADGSSSARQLKGSSARAAGGVASTKEAAHSRTAGGGCAGGSAVPNSERPLHQARSASAASISGDGRLAGSSSAASISSRRQTSGAPATTANSAASTTAKTTLPPPAARSGTRSGSASSAALDLSKVPGVEAGRSRAQPPPPRASRMETLSPRSNLELKRTAARRLQSAFRRRKWRVLLRSVGQTAGGCFCHRTAFRPLVDPYGTITGVRGPSGRWYVGRAFGCLSPLHWLRSLFILLIESPAFDLLIFLTIVANCAVLAFSGRPPSSALHLDPALGETLEWAFTLTFTAELGCKAVAMGVVSDEHHSLLADPWNVLDLAVVVSAWLPFLFPTLDRAAATSLRALRAFRPLRAAHMLPGVRRQVNTLLKALPSLGSVSLLIFVLAGAFSILSMQLFKGSLQHRCYLESALQAGGFDVASFALGGAAPLSVEPIDALEGVCNPAASAAGRAETGGGCAIGSVCLRYGDSPHYGTVSFDTFGAAMMTTFMCISGEGWSEVMYLSMRGSHPSSAFYFIFLAMFGSFYIVNLFLAVLWETYSSLPRELTPEEQVEKARWEREHQHSHRGGEEDDDEEEEPLVFTANARQMSNHWKRELPNALQLGRQESSFMADEPTTCQERLRRMVLSHTFRLFIMGLILANTLLMMMESHPQPESQRRFIELGNLVFFACYCVEMLLKLTSLGLHDYWAEPFNRFDGAVVLISGCEIVVDYLGVQLVGPVDAQILRTFRLLRIFKLARTWNNLYVVISSLLLTLAQLRDLLVVLLLWLFVCALLGMQLFGGGLLDAVSPRDLYNSIEHAMFTVFIAITGEEWNEQWMQVVQAYRMRQAEERGGGGGGGGAASAGIGSGTGQWTGFYYVILVVTGDYIVLNLVVAIVIREVGKADAYVRRLNKQVQSLAYEGNANVRNRRFSLLFASIVPRRDVFEEEGGEGGASGSGGRGPPGGGGDLYRRGEAIAEWLDEHRDYSFFIFGPDSAVRRGAKWILSARIPGTPIGLEGFVIVSIILSSCAVAIDSGCDGSRGATSGGGGSSGGGALVGYLSVALAISLFEIACKAVAFGLVGSDNAYLSSGWNQLDASIALFSLVEVLETGLPGPLVLRSVHVLRPLRLIARHTGMQRVVRTLYEVLPRVFNILLVYGLFLVVFAVLGMQLFGGKFGSCVTASATSATTAITTTTADDANGLALVLSKAECESSAGAEWEARPVIGSFDSVGDAMLLLFEASSLEGWPKALYLAVDAVGVDQSRAVDYNILAGLYFVLWVFLGGFVVLNVFVGVLIDTFAQMENHERFGGVFTSHQQQHWVETLEASTSVQPHRQHKSPRGGSQCRRWLYHHVTSPRTEGVIIGVILANSLIMAADGYGIDPSAHAVLDVANDACTAVFAIEALLKLFALGPIDYLSEGWNIFDLGVVALAIAEKALEVAAASDAASGGGAVVGGGEGSVKGSLFRLVRLARAARVLRTLRMIKASRSVQALLMTLLYSVPPLLNILCIFCILVFVYAVLGMELFKGVMWGDYLNADANFCSFGVAALTMFRCATGEDWNGIMHDAMVTEARGCDPARGDCGSWLAIPFFVSFIILSSFTILKMLIALIIENYKLSKREDQRLVRTVHRDAFVEAWATLDTDGEGRLAVSQLPALIRKLAPPLGLDAFGTHTGTRPAGKALREKDVSRFILSLDLVAYQARGGAGKVVLFHDVLLALTHQALDAQARADECALPTKRDGGGSGGGGGGAGGDGSDGDGGAGGARLSRRSSRDSTPPTGRALLDVVARSRAKAGIQSTQDASTQRLIRATCACDSVTQASLAAQAMRELALEGGFDDDDDGGDGAAASPMMSSKGKGGAPGAAAGGEAPGGGGDPSRTSSSTPSPPAPGAPEEAIRAMQSRQHTISDETDLTNLKAMFRVRAMSVNPHSSMAHLLGSIQEQSGEAAARDAEHGNASRVAHAMLFSLSEEYAVMVLQQRWRERKRRREVEDLVKA